MEGFRQKSFGQRYGQTKFKVRLNKRKLCYIIFAFLCLSEVCLGVLWALGY